MRKYHGMYYDQIETWYEVHILYHKNLFFIITQHKWPILG